MSDQNRSYCNETHTVKSMKEVITVNSGNTERAAVTTFKMIDRSDHLIWIFHFTVHNYFIMFPTFDIITDCMHYLQTIERLSLKKLSSMFCERILLALK
jgi:hypothetical protein